MPFDAGFETVSVVAAVGKGVKGGCLSQLVYSEQCHVCGHLTVGSKQGHGSFICPFMFSPPGFTVGDSVASLTYDGFAEWAVTPAKVALRVPRATPDIIPLLTSGLTASIGEGDV